MSRPCVLHALQCAAWYRLLVKKTDEVVPENEFLYIEERTCSSTKMSAFVLGVGPTLNEEEG